MDARGLLHFAEDVFRSLRGEALVGSDYALMDAELVESLVGDRTRDPLKAKWRSPMAQVPSQGMIERVTLPSQRMLPNRYGL